MGNQLLKEKGGEFCFGKELRKVLTILKNKERFDRASQKKEVL
jgi:hypothetical protein